jgi:hypothetical protein
MKTASRQFVLGPLSLLLRVLWVLIFLLVVIPLAWLAFKIAANW